MVSELLKSKRDLHFRLCNLSHQNCSGYTRKKSFFFTLIENTLDDTEKVRLSQNNPPFYSGPSGLYIPQRDDEVRRSVVRIRPHGDDDSPSPDDPTPMHAKDIRVP